jgi:hypothetical protein
MAEVLGLDALDHNMKALISQVDSGEFENGLLEIDKMLKEELVANTPVGPAGRTSKKTIFLSGMKVGKQEVAKQGNLKKSWRARKFKDKRPGSPAVWCGIERKLGAHGHLVEFGHGGPHPAPAHPFVRPVVDSFKSAYSGMVATMLREKFGKMTGSFTSQEIQGSM